MKKSTFSRLLGYIGRSRLPLIGVFVCALISSVSALIAPRLVGAAIDLIQPKTDFGAALLRMVLLIGGLYLLSCLFNWFTSLCANLVANRTVRALRLYALGLFKYIAVADVLNMVVDTVFPHYADYSAPMLILTAVMYTFYLYFSFSGYSEISRATGLVLGLDLPENFKTPFYATNFSGFWSRWHISFSSWLQDYLFMPLAWADLGRFGRLPTELCVFCVKLDGYALLLKTD